MKNLQLKTFFFLLIFTGSISVSSAQQWKRIGNKFGTLPAANGSGIITQNYYSPALAYSEVTGDLYTAYIDGNLIELTVEKYSTVTKTWTSVGAIHAAIDFTAPSLAINPKTNELYIAYIDNVVHEYIVQKFTGTSWKKIGTVNSKAIENYLPTLQFKPNTNELYIAFIEGANGNNVEVQKFDGNNWNSIANKNIGNATNTLPVTVTGIMHHSCSIAFKPNTAELYIAYINTSNIIELKYLANNTIWTDAGSFLSSNKKLGAASTIHSSALAFNPATNMAYIAFLNDIGNTKVIKEFATKSYTTLNGVKVGPTVIWTDVKSDSIKIGYVAPSFGFNPGTNMPYITGYDPRGGTFNIAKFTGKTWKLLGHQDCDTTGTAAQGPIANPSVDQYFLSVGPGTCGYHFSHQTPTLLFNSKINRAYLAYSVEQGAYYEIRKEP